MKYNLSEITEVIQNRRSIRPKDFSQRKVHREQIEKLLDNARWAPTHGNTQPWHFKVFMGNGLKKLGEFQAEAYKSTTPAEKFMQAKYDKLLNNHEKSSAVIAICMRKYATSKIPELEEIEAVACAVQNMYLTATAYGLAAYWGSGGATYSQEMKTYLELDENDRCLGFFYLGYPDIEWPNGQRKPIEYFTDWIED